MDSNPNLIDDPAEIRRLIQQTRRIAVLGMELPRNRARPAYYVPNYLRQAGFEIVPVPVKHPEAAEVDGIQAYQSISDIPGEIDLVDVFRMPRDIPKHLDDLLRKRPKVVWFQSGIRHDDAARKLAEAGIKVVQDHCLMVEHRRLARR